MSTAGVEAEGTGAVSSRTLEHYSDLLVDLVRQKLATLQSVDLNSASSSTFGRDRDLDRDY
jgi:hypothetical protein